MSYLRITTTFLLSIALAASVLAHDTWLMPDRFAIPQDALVMLDLTSGMAFPALESPIKPERVERALCRLAGNVSDLEKGDASCEGRSYARARRRELTGRVTLPLSQFMSVGNRIRKDHGRRVWKYGIGTQLHSRRERRLA